MLLVYILLILLALIVLKYVHLIFKRMSLVRKIRKISPYPIEFKRNRFASVFSKKGSTDLVVRVDGRDHCISIITTPFRRVRYHFTSTHLELIYERQATVLSSYKPGGNRNTRAYNYHNTFVLKRYKMTPICETVDNKFCFYIIHPAPRVLSMLYEGQLRPLDNGDLLNGHIIACGLKWYLEHINDTNFLSEGKKKRGDE